MTKNEVEIIEDWIKYHGYIFGLENIHILDGSDENYIFDVYSKYKPLGLNVHHSSAGLNDLSHELTELMHKHKGTDNFLIKLDTDEFLAYTLPFHLGPHNFFGRKFLKGYLRAQRRSGGVRKRIFERFIDQKHASKEIQVNKKINELLDQLPVTGQRYKASLTSWSLPIHETGTKPCRSITRFTSLQFTHIKSYFHSSSFVSVDLGGHGGVSTQNSGVIETGLTIIHYHSTSLEDSVRRAKAVLESHGYLEACDDIREQKTKLVKLKRENKIDSIHKIDFYIKYISSLETGNPFPLSTLNLSHPLFRSTGPSRSLTLIRDTLNEIDKIETLN